MSWLKPIFWRSGFWRSGFWTKVLAFTLTLVMASFTVFPCTPVAQAGVWEDLVAVFQPPDGAPPAGRNSGGAGRGPICALSDETLKNSIGNTVIALVPVKPIDSAGESNGELNSEFSNEFTSEALPASPAATLSDLGLVGSFTVAANPTFWFYLPYIATPEMPQNRVAQFVLLDHTDRPVWNELMAVELSDRPQLVEYPLSYALAPDELYQWYFSVICDSEKLSRNPVVRGWVQRTEPTADLQIALRNASHFEQYLAYAHNGIWFDAVKALVDVRRQFPSTNRKDWIELLDYFQIPRVDRFDALEPVQLTQREVVNGNQLPDRM